MEIEVIQDVDLLAESLYIRRIIRKTGYTQKRDLHFHQVYLAFLLDSFRLGFPDPELPYLCRAFLTHLALLALTHLALLAPCQRLAQLHLPPPLDLFLLHL